MKLGKMMPTYNFRNKKTGEELEITMRISELDEYKLNNPVMEQYLKTAPRIVGGVGTNLKVDDGFREVLSKIHNNNYKSNLSGKLSRR